jgi:hypothetical protein
MKASCNPTDTTGSSYKMSVYGVQSDKTEIPLQGLQIVSTYIQKEKAYK